MAIKTKILFVTLVAVLILPSFTSAWTIGEPIVPCGMGPDSNQPVPCDECQLLHLADNLIDFIMIGAAPILATAFFIWAGVLMILGGANPGMLSQGKRMFKDTMIGLLIVMMAWLFTNILITTLINPSVFTLNSGNNWWDLTCSQVFGGSSTGSSGTNNFPNGSICSSDNDCQSGYCNLNINPPICQ